MKRVAIYPGTFDPITFGHWDIIERSLKFVDKLVVAIADNESKNPIFTITERRNMILEDLELYHKDIASMVEVTSFNILTVNLAKEFNANVIIRGIRALSDFDFEFQLAGMNNKLDSNIETLFLMAHDEYQFVSSRFVKEVARLGADISQFVSPKVAEHIKKYYKISGKEKIK